MIIIQSTQYFEQDKFMYICYSLTFWSFIAKFIVNPHVVYSRCSASIGCMNYDVQKKNKDLTDWSWSQPGLH